MAKTRPTPDQSKLPDASHHLLYEWTMLCRTFELLKETVNAAAGERPGVRQAFMESFGVHARALDYFFYADLRRRDPLHETDILGRKR